MSTNKISLSTDHERKSIFSWCLYDWANSAFSTVIITFVFGVYFARQIVGDETEGSAQWSFAISLSGLFIAILSPLLGAIADHSGYRKRWIFWLSMLCIVPTACLWFATPDSSTGHIIFVLVLVGLANIGLELSQVFYNAMLPHVAPKEKVGRISGWAWGLGYLGGLSALAVTLFGLIGIGDMKPLVRVPSENFENIRMTGPFIALWFFIFMLPFFIFTKDFEIRAPRFLNSLSEGVKQLVVSVKNIRHHKNFLTFLIASAIYRDGLITLFAIGGVYAAGQFDMNFTEILIFAIGLNVTAGLGAFTFSYADDAFGSKSTIIVSLLGLIVVGGIILFVSSKMVFIALACVLGIFMGPVQAASRTMVSKLCPSAMITQGYGLYAFAGKSVSFLGPLLFGLAVTFFKTQQAGMATIILFWVVGLLLLLKVKEQDD